MLTTLALIFPFPLLITSLTLPSSHLHKRSEAGPVLPSNFPDPCLVNVFGTWYAFATTSDNVNIPIATAPWNGFQGKWELVTDANGNAVDAFPNVPAWVNMTGPNTWAPDVSILDDGTFIMYFSATTLVDSGKHCVGAATSRSVTGPYVATSDEPLFCPLSQGGAIDAAGFKDWSDRGWGWGPGPYTVPDTNVQVTSGSPAILTSSPGTNSWTNATYSQGGRGGKRYVVYKVDGASIGHGGTCGNSVAPIIPTPIILQQIAADGVTLIGPNTTLLDNQGIKDMGVTEAPSLVKTWDGKYVLFFSHDCYNTPNYTVSYATSDQITGPYKRRGDLFKTGVDGLNGPGGATIHWDMVNMVFHANEGDGYDGVRLLHTAEVSISGNVVSA